MTDAGDDIEQALRLGLGPDAVDRMARMDMAPGAFAEFLSLDPERRALVLRLLDDPSEAEVDELNHIEGGADLARFLLTLPAYQATDEDEED